MDIDSRRKHGLKELWWLLFTIAVGVSIICTSMLAGRRLSSEKSTEKCSWLNYDGNDSLSKKDSSSLSSPLVDQVVLVIIDALTPRVALGPRGHHHHETDSSSSSSSPPPGYFTYIRESIEETEKRFQQNNNKDHQSSSYSSSSFFPAQGFFSVADAPTTTAQRTKAMVTGTIPVLLEAGSSFNSFSVEEDNLIEKLKGRTTVLGDDTWVRLFPEKDSHWQEEHVFESFDVRDLHTVDDGILEYLNDVLVSGSSSSSEKSKQQQQQQRHPKFVITHFLGVDHAGHRYNAHDPHLYKKVDQLNKVLRNMSSILKDRAVGGSSSKNTTNPKSTLLLVMGDHGMTESGDHGGSTPAETDTFLFTQIFDDLSSPSSSSSEEKDTVSPFHLSNLGRKFSQTVRSGHCETSRMCRLTESKMIEKYCQRINCASFSSSSSSLNEAHKITSPLTGIHQIDLVPTLAAIFDLPIPKQNLGRVVPEILLQVLSSACHSSSSSSSIKCDSKKNTVEKMLARFLGCNVRQLHEAFCSEFSSQSPKYEKYCSSSSSSSKENNNNNNNNDNNNNNISKQYSDQNIMNSELFARDPFALIEELDRIAAELSRAAREELTDVDTAAIMVILILCGHVSFSAVLFFYYSTPTSQRFVFSISFVAEKHASIAQLEKRKSESFHPSVKQLVKRLIILIGSTAIIDVLLASVAECNSKIVFFVAVPLFISNLMSVDHRHYCQQGYQLFFSFSGNTKRKHLCISAFLAFFIYSWRIGIQESNSCIAREEVMTLMMTVLGMIFCRHLEGLVTNIKNRSRNNDSKSSGPSFPLMKKYWKLIVIGSITSFALLLGRRSRDFDSHFIDGQALTQKLFSNHHRLLLLSSSSPQALRNSGIISNKMIIFFVETVSTWFPSLFLSPQQQTEAFFARESQSESRRSNAWIFLTAFFNWLVVETPFIHFLLLGTLIFLFLINKVFPKNNNNNKQRGGGTIPVVINIIVNAIRSQSWKIFFVVFFFWNVTVSNITSLPAFILQSLTLYLWAKWFPLARHQKGGATFTLFAKRNSISFRYLQLCNMLDGFVLHLFAWVFFFASGFHCMFSTIDWNVAFIGVSSVNMIFGGILIFVHTFRSFIVVIVVAIYVDGVQRRSRIIIDDDKERRDNYENYTHDWGNEKEKEQEKKKSRNKYFFGIVGLAPTFIFFNTSILISMMHSMIRHRGHLMVWEVFFPRFAFEVGVFCCNVVGLAVMQFFCGTR